MDSLPLALCFLTFFNSLKLPSWTTTGANSQCDADIFVRPVLYLHPFFEKNSFGQALLNVNQPAKTSVRQTRCIDRGLPRPLRAASSSSSQPLELNMKKFLSTLAAAAILATPFAVTSMAQAASHTGAPMTTPAAAPSAAPAAAAATEKAPVKKMAKKSKKTKRMVKKAA